MYIYQIRGWDLRDGDQVKEVILTVVAKTEEAAQLDAIKMAPRLFYDTLSVEDAPIMEGAI